jgi:hypothetical protein
MNSRIAKKSPEESRFTQMMTAQGWMLTGGNNVWLIFKKKGVPGEIVVTRGTKEWAYDRSEDVDADPAAQGKGFQSLQKALPTIQKAKAIHADLEDEETNPLPAPFRREGPNVQRITGTDHQGHAQLGDAQNVLNFLQANGPKLPQQVAEAFGWSYEQAYGMLEHLRAEGKIGIKQMRYYVKQASRFRFKSKILYRKTKPVSIFQSENKTIKEGGPQGDDISRKSDGDYPKMRRSR